MAIGHIYSPISRILLQILFIFGSKQFNCNLVSERIDIFDNLTDSSVLREVHKLGECLDAQECPIWHRWRLV